MTKNKTKDSQCEAKYGEKRCENTATKSVKPLEEKLERELKDMILQQGNGVSMNTIMDFIRTHF